jgi:hypothetical protein
MELSQLNGCQQPHTAAWGNWTLCPHIFIIYYKHHYEPLAIKGRVSRGSIFLKMLYVIYILSHATKKYITLKKLCVQYIIVLFIYNTN